jgi:hypothetical protein
MVRPKDVHHRDHSEHKGSHGAGPIDRARHHAGHGSPPRRGPGLFDPVISSEACRLGVLCALCGETTLSAEEEAGDFGSQWGQVPTFNNAGFVRPAGGIPGAIGAPDGSCLNADGLAGSGQGRSPPRSQRAQRQPWGGPHRPCKTSRWAWKPTTSGPWLVRSNHLQRSPPPRCLCALCGKTTRWAEEGAGDVPRSSAQPLPRPEAGDFPLRVRLRLRLKFNSAAAGCCAGRQRNPGSPPPTTRRATPRA